MPIVNQTSLGLVGVNIFEATTEQKYALGARVRASRGDSKDRSGELIYIQTANSGLAANLLYELPLISGTDAFKVDTSITTTSAGTFLGATVGAAIAVCVPAVTTTASEYCWAYVSGHFVLTCAANCVALAQLYTTVSGGVVDDTPTAFQLMNAWPTTTVGGSSAATICYAAGDLRVQRVS